MVKAGHAVHGASPIVLLYVPLQIAIYVNVFVCICTRILAGYASKIVILYVPLQIAIHLHSSNVCVCVCTCILAGYASPIVLLYVPLQITIYLDSSNMCVCVHDKCLLTQSYILMSVDA